MNIIDCFVYWGYLLGPSKQQFIRPCAKIRIPERFGHVFPVYNYPEYYPGQRNSGAVAEDDDHDLRGGGYFQYN